jgi:N-acetylmuramoyl-L-alanine amidase
MSVARAREINARLRAAGITVHEWAGWERRGNGQLSAYEGGIVHHTASGFGNAYASLVNGRRDLPGPLCNWAGNQDGSLTVIAAHPANHAGASGGRSMGPLPLTTLFNKRVLGLEIVYPGTEPMRPAQYQTALVWARVVADVVAGGNLERIRAHFETSVTGKIDISWSVDPVRHYDMSAFRTQARTALEDLDMALTDYERDMLERAGWRLYGLAQLSPTVPGGPVEGEELPLVSKLNTILVKLDALAGELSDSEAAILAAVRAMPTGGQVDIATLAAALAPLIPAGVTSDQVQQAIRLVFADASDPTTT